MEDLDKATGTSGQEPGDKPRVSKDGEDAAGVSAAARLVRRSDEFEQARQQLPHLIQALSLPHNAGRRWILKHGATNKPESALEATSGSRTRWRK